MSIVERTLNLAEKPVSDKLVQSWHKNRNIISRKFLKGEIDIVTYKSKLKEMGQPTWTVTLPYPGPLYGLLRKIGVDNENSKLITYEERDHYLKCKENGLRSEIHIQFIKSDTTVSEDTVSGEMKVYLTFEIPKDVSDEKAREIIREVLSAPPNPSTDDLAKLGK